MRKAPEHIVFCVQITVEEDGEIYYAQCPQLGCIHVCGESVDEARKAAEDAFVAYVGMSLKNGDPIPPEVIATQATQGFAEVHQLEENHSRRTQTFVEEVGLAFA